MIFALADWMAGHAVTVLAVWIFFVCAVVMLAEWMFVKNRHPDLRE
jgi:hypothetical protein